MLLVRRIVGHSMLPVLPPGTLVLGLKWIRKLRPGMVVVIVHDGKEKIKRIDKIKTNKIFVTGDHEVASTDSRHFGWIPKNVVKAKIVWPQTKKI